MNTEEIKKGLIFWCLLLKIVLFGICLIITIPLAFVFPSYFISGTEGFLDRFLDDIEKYKILNKEETDELRKDI